MEVEIKTWLTDIQKAIAEINSFLPDQKNYINFQNDLKTMRAVERNLEIIGEAVMRIVQKDPKIIIANSRKIIDTRNRIIHGYENVSLDIIWSIVIRDLPMLGEEVNQLLSDY